MMTFETKTFFASVTLVEFIGGGHPMLFDVNKVNKSGILLMIGPSKYEKWRQIELQINCGGLFVSEVLQSCFCSIIACEVLSQQLYQMLLKSQGKGNEGLQNRTEEPPGQGCRKYFRVQGQKKQTNLVKPYCISKSRFFQNRQDSKLSLVAVPIHAIFDSLEIYEWRDKTDYPIIQTQWCGVLLDKTIPIIRNHASLQHYIRTCLNKPSKAYIEVVTQSITPLSDFGLLSFSSMAYVAKESLIGFERLFALFGVFTISPQCIGVSSEGRVKVWLTFPHQQNTKSSPRHLSSAISQQMFMVSQLNEVLKGFSQNSGTSRAFFSLVGENQTFLDLLKIIEDFTESRKILIARTIKKDSKRFYSPSIVQQKHQKRHHFLSPFKDHNHPFKLTFISNSHQPSHIASQSPDSSQFVKILLDLQTKQSLEKDNSEGCKYRQRYESDQTPSSIGPLTEKSHKMKKANSLERHLEDLFLDDCASSQEEGCAQDGNDLGLRGYGRKIDESAYLDNSIEQI